MRSPLAKFAAKLCPFLFVVLGLSACASKDPGTPTAAVDAGPGNITCTTDPRAMTYTANMAQMGTSGMYKFVLAQSDPAPPAKGTNTWTLKLTDASQNNVTGATIDVLPYMPDHMHGTSVDASVTPNADGTYTVTPLYLFMPGIWTITFTAHIGTVTDKSVFSFCIEG